MGWDWQGTRAWWGREGARARARLGPWPNGTRGTGARHAICGLEIKLVSEQENEKRKNDTLSWLKYEPVNEDTDNVEEADNDEWDVEVASVHVEVKKCKI